MKAFLAALALLTGCQPALAATYGPPAPVEAEAPPRGERWLTQDDIDTAEATRADDTKSAWRRFWIGQGLAATDIALTCVLLSKRNPDGTRRFREGNPIYGANAGCGRIAGIRAGVSALQYLIVRRSIRRDPEKAKRGLNIVIAVQGVPVIWNAIQLAK